MKKLHKILLVMLVCTLFLALPVTVSAKTTVKLNKTKVSLTVGKTTTLKATVSPKAKVTWKSSNTKVATVSSSGKITAKKAGTCTITATAKGVKASCKVTVKKDPKKTAQKYLEEHIWNTVGGGKEAPFYLFVGDYIKCYNYKGDFISKIKYDVVQTSYGYYIKIKDKNLGYRLVLKGTDADKKALQCIGNGDPDSIADYSGSSSWYYV